MKNEYDIVREMVTKWSETFEEDSAHLVLENQDDMNRVRTIEKIKEFMR